MKKLKQIRLSKIEKFGFINAKDLCALDCCANLLKNNVGLIVLNPNDIDKNNFELAQNMRQLVSIYNSVFIIKNRFDIAKIVDADGVLADINSIPQKQAAKFLGDEKYYGFLVNNQSDIKSLNMNDFDFIISNSLIETDIKVFNQTL